MEQVRPGEHGHSLARADEASVREGERSRAGQRDVPPTGQSVVLDHEHGVLAKQRGVE
jgi:hypothetical protein